MADYQIVTRKQLEEMSPDELDPQYYPTKTAQEVDYLKLNEILAAQLFERGKKTGRLNKSVISIGDRN